MRKLVIMGALVASTNAMALDFETEWAKFKDDFAKIASQSTVKIDVDVPVVGNVPVVTIPLEKDEVEVKKIDPQDPNLMGNKVSDPALKEKLHSLYKRPDVVVYSTTVR